jgi:hypothetical protein
MFLSVNGTAQSYGTTQDVPSRCIRGEVARAGRQQRLGRGTNSLAGDVQYGRALRRLVSVPA